MLKDHVDLDQLKQKIRDYIANGGPEPIVARYRLARAGEVCGGCKRPLREGKPVMEAIGDGSVGHATCHSGGTLEVR